MEWGRIDRVEDVCREGDTMRVKVIEIDPASGKVRLSRKELLEKPEGWEDRPPRPPGGRGRRSGGRDGGRDRDRDRGRGGRGGDRRRGGPPRGGNRR
jgi:polyribonucleotide nucleotidyltransferase